MLASVAYTVPEWSDLFVATTGASAALTGLVFVAVSINVERILSGSGLPERALMTLALLLGVTVVSILGLIPGQSTTALGAELLGQGLLWGALVTPLLVKSLPRDAGRGGNVGRIAVVALSVVPFAVGGLSLIAESGGGLYWVAGGIVAATLGGVINAWVLLVEILR